MDPEPREQGETAGEQISSLINEYFDRRQAGEDLTPERFAAEHPRHADELRPYLAGLDLIEKVRGAAGDPDPTTTELPHVEGYELLEEIGRGGMGVVYRAVQLSTKRVVALKVMLAGPFASPTGRRRFKREIELEARLEHPGIVRVLEGGEAGGQPYYAMEYVRGLRLDRYLSKAQLETQATLEVITQICDAAEYAHTQGVVHRDLKPANVLVDDEGRAHILDFGLAKATDQTDTEVGAITSVSVAGQVVGTLPYLAPEQAAGKTGEIDVRTDVYALGVMLFEALTGTLPLDTSGRPSEVLERIVEVPPTPPSSISDRVDRELEAIILKALEKNKEARYLSAEAMADDIRRYGEGEPILAQPPSSLYLFRKKLHKYRMRVAAVTVIVVAVSIGLWADARSRRRDLTTARHAAVQQRMWEDRDPVAALSNAKELYAKYPDLPEARLILTQAEYRNETERAAAILTLERALRSDPARWAHRALLAEFYRATGHTERADMLKAQAEREAPDTADAWYLRSFATLDLEEALRCTQEAVRRKASDAIAWRRLTYLRLHTGDLDGALAGADRLIELGEDAGELIFFKGQALATRGRFRDAIEQYSLLATVWPTPPECVPPPGTRLPAHSRVCEGRRRLRPRGRSGR